MYILVEILFLNNLPEDYSLSADDVALGVNLIKHLTLHGAGFELGFGFGCHWWVAVESIVAGQETFMGQS